MKMRWPARLISLLLCLCLLPAAVLAQEQAEVRDENAVTRSLFTLDLDLNADAFPADGQTDFQGWEALFKKLSLRGTIDTQRFLDPLSRVYMESQLCLNGEPSVPFIYEGYWSYRYLRSKALLDQSLHFQMDNFLEFMLKPYYYMGLNTQYLGLLLYPEASVYLWQAYGEPIRDMLEKSGEGSRNVSYVELYELCEQLDAIATDDDRERVYFYLTALLVDFQASDSAYEGVSYLEDYLDFLDPEQQGMTITRGENSETYAIGNTTVLSRTWQDEKFAFTLTLPDREGYELTVFFAFEDRPDLIGYQLNASLAVTAEDDARVQLALSLDNLPYPWQYNCAGTLRFTVDGSSLMEPVKPVTVLYNLYRNALQPPHEVQLRLDWLHPDTGKPAIVANYSAKAELYDQGLLQDHLYDNLHDFFHLNEDYLEECKQKYTLPLTLAFTPILMETPPGVINDILRFLNSSGFLASLGIE